MLSRLKIENIALIDQLEVEFGTGLNVLSGETGSGKSIIVDSLGALTGDRLYSDLIKEGTRSASIEGLFELLPSPDLINEFGNIGIEIDVGGLVQIIIRRDLMLNGKNRIFVNDKMVTQAFLKTIGPELVNIHGQGEQTTLYDISTHIEMLDRFAGEQEIVNKVGTAFENLSAIRNELAELNRDEAEKLQLVDVLKFQVGEIESTAPEIDEDTTLEEEKLRLNNIEKLSTLSDEIYSLLYDDNDSTVATIDRAAKRVAELAEFDPKFGELAEGLTAASAIVNDAAITTRDFRGKLENSPERLETIEQRLAELSRITRKYGGTIDAVLEHLAVIRSRLASIESSDLIEAELRRKLAESLSVYYDIAERLSKKRSAAARRFEKNVLGALTDVALEKARFEVRIETPTKAEFDSSDFAGSTRQGYDQAEFYFSANPGDSPKPLAKVASGGEASRLMLILKTVAKFGGAESTAVFDEIDVGIGGRVAEAVGRKLKSLAAAQQVLCVTHQAQIASFADSHFVVEKDIATQNALVTIRELSQKERIEEIARMLAGEQITEAARENARAMLASTR